MKNLNHLIIRASAGSGKTFALSSRYIILLALDFAPETILATTFTRKAASEILERVLRRLATAATNEAGARNLSAELSEELKGTIEISFAQCVSMLERVCRALHRVSISTLDGAFNRIASCFRLELGIPADPDVLDDQSAAAKELRRDAINVFLEKSDFEKSLNRLRALQNQEPGSSVLESFDAILANLRNIFIASPAEAWAQFRPCGRKLSEEKLQSLEATFQNLQATVTNKILRSAIEKSIRGIRERNWELCCQSGPLAKMLDREDEQASLSYQAQSLDDPIFEPFRELKSHCAAVLTQALKEKTLATRELLERFNREFVLLQRERQIVFFTDLPRLLADAMDASGDLAHLIGYRLDGTVRHLLLDEFQDTNRDQWRVLRPTAQEIVSEGPPSESGRSFFCVGDVKQAIYGWRGGSARLFDKVASDLHFDSDNMETRNESWRSAQVVLDAVDRVFQSLEGNVALIKFKGSTSNWKRNFQTHTAHYKNMQGYVELITSPQSKNLEPTAAENDDGKENIEGPGSIHPNYVAEKIKAYADRQGAGPWARPACSIGVLVMKNKTAQDYLTRLRKLGLQASGESGNRLDIEPAVAVILSALLLADHPGDTASAFHVLTSPLRDVCGIRPGRPIALEHLAEISLSLRERVISEGLPAVVASWAAVLAGSCDDRSGAIYRLERLIELADRFKPRNRLRVSEFVEHVALTTVEEQSPARVRVMTINKAKGLEFDIVVLPQLSDLMGRFNGAVCVEQLDPAAAPTAVLCSGTSLDRSLNDQLKRVYDQELERRADDDLAKLYVAMTRARHELHMIVPPLSQKKDGNFRTDGYSNACYATLLRRALTTKGDEENVAGEEIIFASGDSAWEKISDDKTPVLEEVEEAQREPDHPAFDILNVRFAPPSTVLRRGLPQVAPSSLAGRGRVSAATLLVDSAHGPDRGSLMHKWFEQIAWIDDPMPADELFLTVARREFPWISSDLMSQRLLEFRKIIATPHVIAALTRPDDKDVVLWKERPFVIDDATRIINGRIDRVAIVRKDGRPVSATLYDFKTDRILNDDELRTAVEEYKPQMTIYRRALELLLKLEEPAIQSFLLFVDRELVRL